MALNIGVIDRILCFQDRQDGIRRQEVSDQDNEDIKWQRDSRDYYALLPTLHRT
jgi:hypothetical protein